MYYPFGRYMVTFSIPYVEEPFWGTSWFSQQTDDYFVKVTHFYSLVRCHEVSSTPILQFSAKSVLHPFLYQPGNQLLSANRMLRVSFAWNLRDNCFVEMTLQPKFSLLSLSQLANIKLGEQYKNYKVYTSKQTFHINR